MAKSSWQAVEPGLWLFRDSCNVYAAQGPSGMLIIDAGTGAWLDHLDELPAPPAALALTHYFRDHAAGAVRAAKAGIAVYAPQYERDILADPAQHFRERETYIIYDNVWNLHAPIEPTKLAGAMPDYGVVELAGLKVEVVPLPGATLSQSGYALSLPAGRRVVFCGETVHSPGRVPRVAPWQYNYNDFGGGNNTAYSIHVLGQREIDILAPSLGEPMIGNVAEALRKTAASIEDFLEAFGRKMYRTSRFTEPELTKVTDHVYVSTHSNARSWFLIGESGKVMAIDYGYDFLRLAMPQYARPAQRRALLHGIAGLKDICGADRLDVVLVSHFHDDHVAGIPLLQRLHGTQCWASEAFADLLEHPEAHCFPCNWPQPIKVHRRIGMDETVQWEQFRFHFGAMSGHTRFASLIGFEADGKRFAHAGDQVFYRKGWVPGSDNDDRVLHNHVYRNGALLDGYHQCARWMTKWNPHVILTGHTPPLETNETMIKALSAGADEYRQRHEQVMPLGEDEAHFDVDSWGGWIWPYRVHLDHPRAATVRVTVRNPLPTPAELHIKLVGPEGWQGQAATLQAAPRAEVSCELSITPSGNCRRQPFAAELTVDGQPYGQVAEGLMTAGKTVF